MADGHVAEYACAAANIDTILDGWDRPWLIAGCEPKSCAMTDVHVVADRTGT
jgi:hypothetical protein